MVPTFGLVASIWNVRWKAGLAASLCVHQRSMKSRSLFHDEFDIRLRPLDNKKEPRPRPGLFLRYVTNFQWTTRDGRPRAEATGPDAAAGAVCW